MGLVILEGVDLTGKTTLARELEARHDFRYRHAGPPRAHPLVEYVGGLRTFDPRAENLVLDRWHLGELVWPQIFVRPTRYTYWMNHYVELFLASRGALVVACTGAEREVVERLRHRGDAALSVKDVGCALTLFTSVFTHSKLMRLAHSIEQPVNVDVVVAIAASLAEEVADIVAITREYVGSPTPTLLLVGDCTGPRNTSNLGVPFAPFEGTSGAYLLHVIARTRRHAIGVTNAHVHDRDGHAHLEKLHARLDAPLVVALGNAADDALREVSIPHGVVPHPQFVRRFHYSRLGEYAASIVHAGVHVVDTRPRWR